MSWTRTLATGSGALEFRLSIEGFEFEAVTATSMEGSDGDTPARTRYVGLQRDGIIIDEQSNLRDGKLKLGSMTLRIADIAGRWTAAFSQKPTKTTWLRVNASTSDTAIEVSSTSGWTTSDVLHIGTEAMDVTAIPDGDTFTVTRAEWQTIAQKHWTSDGAHLRRPMVTNYPQCIEGRRARLYVYGGGDDLTSGTGDGTLVWIGIVSTEPSLVDGTTWEITIDPLTRLWQSDIGEDLEEPVTPRGIYYPWCAPLLVTLVQGSTATGGVFNYTTVGLEGFYATQSAFCDTLTARMGTAATAAGMTGTFAATPLEDGTGYRVTYTAAAGGSPLFATIEVESFIDPTGAFAFRDSSGVPLETAVAETTYSVTFDSPVPRGVWRKSYDVGLLPFCDETLRDTFPPERVYVGGTITVDGDMTAAQIEWADDGSAGMYSLDTALDDATSRYVHVRRRSGEPGGHAYAWPLLPELKFGREYGTSTSGGSLHSLLNAICTDAPTFANIGGVPFVTYSDFDDGSTLATTLTVVTEAAAGRSFLTNRRYLAFGARKLEDWIAEECKLLGIFPRLNASGRLTFSRLKLPVSSEVSAADITAPSTLMDSGFPGWSRNAYGMVNTVVIRTGYDPVEDEHTGHTYVVRDVAGFGINRAVRQDEIAPFSYALLEESALTIEQIRSVASPILAVFGAPYYTVTIGVPLTLFGVLLGDVVTLVSAHLPDPDDGTRGWTTAKPALVVGRNWDLATGRGTLTLLGHAQNLAGYAPSMRITADVINDPGTDLDHTLTVSGTDEDGNTNAYIPSGTDATDFFAVDYKARTLEFDATAPATAVGTVTAVTATTVRVTFTSATTTRANHHIGFNDANTASIATAQKLFCFIAGTDGLIDYPSDAQSARVMGL